MTDKSGQIGCPCGGTHAAEAHDRKHGPAGADGVEQALLVGLFPEGTTRRRLLAALGAGLILDAASSFLPLDTMRAMAAGDPVKPEKVDLTIGIEPVVCAAPLIVAQQRGLFEKNGIAKVKFAKSSSSTALRDRLKRGDYDFAQQAMPLPLTTSLGSDGPADLTQVLAMQSQHGSALILALKHRDNRDPKAWKGMRFGVPFEQSQQALVLRYLLAEQGLDPDLDVSLRAVSPDQAVAQLRNGVIDGFYVPEPYGQRAIYEGIGFLHTLSRDIWPGHPCCAFTARAAWIERFPQTFIATYRAVVEAAAQITDPAQRAGLAAVLARPEYLDQPALVISQVLEGRYADGLGSVREVPDRILFNPYPHYAMAVWLLSQLRRWGMVKGTVNYAEIARKVMLATEAEKRLAELGLPVPAQNAGETILGRAFDPTKVDDYLAGHKIRRG